MQASLVAAEKSIQPGRALTVALRPEHEPPWPTYRLNAGMGFPTRLKWDLPANWIRWPTPILIKDSQAMLRATATAACSICRSR